MKTKDKIIDVETIDYVFNNMGYDWYEIKEELKEAIGLTSKFQKQKIIEEIKVKRETYPDKYDLDEIDTIIVNEILGEKKQ